VVPHRGASTVGRATFAGVDGHGDVNRSGPVSRVSVSLESYVRLGMAFGQ
jgi:hypothetical protein